jgi:hypothetical protein
VSGPDAWTTHDPTPCERHGRDACEDPECLPVDGSRKSLFRSARELATLTPEKVDWVIQGFVARGSTTELTARPKIGKTTLISHWVSCALRGDLCMGAATARQTPVVYLTEQAPTSFREVLRRWRLLDRDDLRVLTYCDVVGKSWPAIVKMAHEEALRVRSEWIIVDTLHPFAGLRGDSENNAGSALEVMEPLQRVNADRIAVLITRHERKGGGEVGESGRGSSAFTGAADVILSMKRPPGNQRPTVRVIEALSRFEGTPANTAIEKTGGSAQGPNQGVQVWAEQEIESYVVLGDTDAVQTEQATDVLLQVLPASFDKAMTLEELVELTAFPRTTVQRALNGVPGIETTGRGKKSNPKRYYRVDSAQNNTPRGANGHDPNRGFTFDGDAFGKVS